jgi:hypothetical protein
MLLVLLVLHYGSNVNTFSRTCFRFPLQYMYALACFMSTNLDGIEINYLIRNLSPCSLFKNQLVQYVGESI